MEKTKRGLNSNMLKLIAIAAMTIDHIAWAAFPGYPRAALPVVMHILGRLTCPIMCFFIAEGYYHTRNVNKYTLRLFVFAVISHFAYVYASGDYIDARSFIPFYYGSVLNQTSVMWALAWGLVMLRAAKSERIKSSAVRVLLVLLICLVSFPSDWSCIAPLCVMAFGTNRGDVKKQGFWLIFYVAIYAAVYFFAIDRLYGLIQMGVVLSIPLIVRYNGERGRSGALSKWFFYVYYPLHLLIIGLILHM